MSITLEHVHDDDWGALNHQLDVIGIALNPPVPQARVFNSANIATAHGTAKFLTFDSERYDNGNLHSTSVNTSRLTVPIAGLYLISAHVAYAGSAAGIRQTGIMLNGTTYIALDLRPGAAAGVYVSMATEYHLLAGEYVEIQVFQDSGGALNINAANNYSPEFSMHRVAGFTNLGV